LTPFVASLIPAAESAFARSELGLTVTAFRTGRPYQQTEGELTQPAIVSVPLAFAAMIAGSLATAAPADIGAHMLALHAPEGLGREALDRARA